MVGARVEPRGDGGGWGVGDGEVAEIQGGLEGRVVAGGRSFGCIVPWEDGGKNSADGGSSPASRGGRDGGP